MKHNLNTLKMTVYAVILIGVFTGLIEAASASSNIWIVAEDADTINSPMRVASDPSVPNGEYIWMLDGAESGVKGGDSANWADETTMEEMLSNIHNFIETGVQFWNMSPSDSLVTSGTAYCLANPRNEYVIYLPNGGSVTVDLSDAAGILDGEWYDPKGGTYYDNGTVTGGGSETFTPPFNGDAILHIFTTANETVYPGATWESKTPAEVGLDEEKLDQFVANVGGVGCIVKDGYMVKTWGTQTSKADWASAGKPVISTLLMFAVDEGKLTSVDALVKDWGWSLISKDQSMTLRHLANMVSGYARGEEPGAAWTYNDYAIKLYGLTMEKVFHQSLNDAALQRLAPLQLEDGSLFSSRGGLGVSTTPRDFARIGWLWLNKGNWNGTQLLPQSFFDNYMKPGVPSELPRTQTPGSDYLEIGTYGGGTDQTPYGPGIYGFNWWFNANVGTTNNLTWPDAPSDTFQANGHFRKEVMTIIPRLGLVVAARGDWGTFEPGNANAGMNQNLKLLVEAVHSKPLAGQIIVDPDTKMWLAYNRDYNRDGKQDPFFMCGPGDPEGFLYRGTRNADGTRNGDQMTHINKMKGTGANSIYLMAVRSHGGDGDDTQNPFVDSDPTQALDDDILNQWETWFTEMDNNGIVIFFFFYDDNIKVSNDLGWPLDDSDNLHPQEQYFIETIVNRFEHHKHLIWCIMEEVEEMGSDYVSHAKKIAEAICQADDYDHVIAVHKREGLDFSEFANDPNIDQFAIQYRGSASELHNGMVTAWSNAAGKYNLNMAEAANHGMGDTARKKNWACAMGGAYVMIIGMNIANTAMSDLEDCGRLVSFMESTNLNVMAPYDEIVTSGTGYCLASPGAEYVIYLPDGGPVTVNLSDATGALDVEWYDPKDGTYHDGRTVTGGESESFTPPFSGDAVLHIVSTIFDTGNGSYSSICGTHTGAIKPTDDIAV